MVITRIHLQHLSVCPLFLGGLLSNQNSPNALLDAMTNQSALQLGAVGALSQIESSVGKAIKSKKDEYETTILSVGKVNARKDFVTKLAKQLNKL